MGIKRFWIRLAHRITEFRQVRATEESLNCLIEDVLSESTLSGSYLVLVIGSCAIATFGLLSNSAAVIIGAMIIAPLMLPIRGIALAALIGDLEMFQISTIAVTVGTLLAIMMAWTIGLVTGLVEYGSEVMSRSQPNLLDLGIAVAAGAISGYAKAEPKISSTLAGTAISVALMPPVCVIGLGLAQMNMGLSLGASLLYLTNLLGITLSCMIVFLISGYIPFRQGHRPLAGALILTGVLLVPLGLSFTRLVNQVRLQNEIRRALVSRTVTFQRLELLNLNTDWLSDPPTIILNVRALEPVTPKQVFLIEEFIAREMNQRFRVVFQASEVDVITSDPLFELEEKPVSHEPEPPAAEAEPDKSETPDPTPESNAESTPDSPEDGETSDQPTNGT
ncbi:DUF389 domain-containing protein [Candidatus Synechococcus calcipolaris G9]|uniref:DUF389 domain-containing protein n=1 Tax=Candidatus Synechococcus calcipolaris G9 TaxID=1497997 RepID=A0ABT6F385_9SYNE|nr:DUF389 domain-containing protein [Candidatus Synechococcus calcipolaris]MDG2992251.1 DUF389 domain-containing protein [Candidatus Synechococcus calcipolaris G9]